MYHQIGNFMNGKVSNLFTGLEKVIHTVLLNAHALNVEEQIRQTRLCLCNVYQLIKTF